jgi:protein-S-isoprenylcysteine O-methyltransferase Ste14
MGKIKVFIFKVLYGLLFVAAVPALLILWAKLTDKLIVLSVPGNNLTGGFLLAAGALLLVSGMLQLMISGKGLPMNAFPPARFVKTGVYAFISHPIYSGAVLISFGLAMIMRSSSGFWLVSPVFTLMTVSYVAGFENERTESHFGKSDYTTFLSLPPADDVKPSLREKFSACLLFVMPWLVICLLIRAAGTPADAVLVNLRVDDQWPVLKFTWIFSFFIYVFVFMVPATVKTRAQLRRYITDMLFAAVLTLLVFLILPFVIKQKELIPQSLPWQLLFYDPDPGNQVLMLISFQVVWAFIAAAGFARTFNRLRWIFYFAAVLMAASCITTGSSSLAGVVAGFALFLFVSYRQFIWNLIRLLSERLANSWREWRIGPVRVINHGFYGGFAGLTGMLIAGSFLGRQYAFAGFLIMICVIIGAALWAQFIEGSPKLLRPYGYYGGLTGGLIACILFSLIFSVNIWFLLGSMTMSAPWIQAAGRLRCLVQGCCHGRPSGEKTGIRFTHPLSRVNKISGLNGVSLHPTQLYSIGCNLVTGLILLRLYRLQMPAVFITGIYLVMNGLGRFVEESLRGEAQTPYWGGMRIYQWIAIINILAGGIFTAIPQTVTLSFQFNIGTVFLAIATGILVLIASGVDFPSSNRRFARLTS